MPHIVGIDCHDIRFPTSAGFHGSDAMHKDPDYSAAYVVIKTSDGLEGHGFAFTIGRGNEVVCAAIRALEPYLTGFDIDRAAGDLGEFGRRLTHDSQLRWLGPEKGAMHMAAAAVINAMWDLIAKVQGQPVWRLLSAMSPEQLADLVDWRYIEDALDENEAIAILQGMESGRAQRIQTLEETGYPAYATSPGWLGYDDDTVIRLSQEAVRDGFRQIKLKVGADLEDDLRRLKAARKAVGPDVKIAVDANQRWGVQEAITWTKALAPYDPWWVEEPTNPDDVLGHAAIRKAVAPIKVATGEHAANRVVFKQLLQAGAIDVVQIDACRVAGVTENVAILLLAAKFGVPVCPHAGGVGLCELVQHLAIFDYIAVSGSLDDRALEYVDHLHEHFTDPVVIKDGRYIAPQAPGFSAQMQADSLVSYNFPHGPAWSGIIQ